MRTSFESTPVDTVRIYRVISANVEDAATVRVQAYDTAVPFVGAVPAVLSFVLRPDELDMPTFYEADGEQWVIVTAVVISDDYVRTAAFSTHRPDTIQWRTWSAASFTPKEMAS